MTAFLLRVQTDAVLLLVLGFSGVMACLIIFGPVFLRVAALELVCTFMFRLWIQRTQSGYRFIVCCKTWLCQ
jgi:hypothetical protein